MEGRLTVGEVPGAALQSLPPIGASRRLADAVSDALRDAISDGRLAPGLRLREVMLARQLGVSATPVREALRQLEREGLVAVDPHRGAAVAALTVGEFVDLYEIHEILECRAVRRAAEADWDGGEIDRLETLLADAEPLLGQPEQTQFNRLDLAFHLRLNRLSGNHALAELTVQLHRRIQAVRVHCVGHLPGRPADSQAQHREILEAVRRRDADRAEALARAHIRSTRDAVVRVLGAATTGEGG
jgi:DNA-binding GntR family transcriptional regulator